jgi:hypothetical protein
MRFELQECISKDDSRRHRIYPIFGVGPFDTRAKAAVAAKKQVPQYGSWIEVISGSVRPAAKKKASPKKRRRLTNLRRPRH